MRTLVIETATAACSVALIEGERVIDRRHQVVGRGHAERLVPMIAELDKGGRAGRVLVDAGPGSFTGIRVGLAAARALGLGWGVPVCAYSSTALLAARGYADGAAGELAAVLQGGHGEVFMQVFARSPAHADAMATVAPLASLAPPAAAAALGDRRAIGDGVRWLAGLVSDDRLSEALPDAADALLLPPALCALPPVPIYGRPPDARPMA